MNKIYCIRCRKKFVYTNTYFRRIWHGRASDGCIYPWCSLFALRKKELDPALIRYPFKALQVLPLNRKFSEDLTHRDYLGSILNLGIDRSKPETFLLKIIQRFYLHMMILYLFMQWADTDSAHIGQNRRTSFIWHSIYAQIWRTHGNRCVSSTW